jgi:hypothetical protein
MGTGKKLAEYSRRLFLKTSGTLLAGGVFGSVATNAFSQSSPATGEAPALPWPWPQIDPMEAGSRAYHIYLKAGG